MLVGNSLIKLYDDVQVNSEYCALSNTSRIASLVRTKSSGKQFPKAKTPSDDVETLPIPYALSCAIWHRARQKCDLEKLLQTIRINLTLCFGSGFFFFFTNTKRLTYHYDNVGAKRL